MTSNQIRDGLKEIQNYASEIGRDISDLDVAPQFQVYVGKTDEEAWSKFKETQHYKHDESLKNSTLKNQQYDYRELLLIGSKEHVKNRIGDYIDAGVTTFAAMIFSTNTIDEMVDMMQLFAEDIMPEFTK